MFYNELNEHINVDDMNSTKARTEIAHLKQPLPNTDVLSGAGLSTLYTLLRQRRLRWFGHVHHV